MFNDRWVYMRNFHDEKKFTNVEPNNIFFIAIGKEDDGYGQKIVTTKVNSNSEQTVFEIKLLFFAS